MSVSALSDNELLVELKNPLRAKRVIQALFASTRKNYTGIFAGWFFADHEDANDDTAERADQGMEWPAKFQGGQPAIYLAVPGGYECVPYLPGATKEKSGS